jgi:hypothetical protein
VPRAQAIYEQGLNQGQSFDQIERALAEACPELKSPLVPRNVPWFTAYFTPSRTPISRDRGQRFTARRTPFHADRGQRFSVMADSGNARG